MSHESIDRPDNAMQNMASQSQNQKSLNTCNPLASIQSTDIWSSQEWAADPDMIQLHFGALLLSKAEAAIAFMRKNQIDSVMIKNGFNFLLCQDIDGLDEDDIRGKEILVGKNSQGAHAKFVKFKPEYGLDQCYAEISKDSTVRAVFTLQNSHNRLYCHVGNVDHLLTIFKKEAQT